MNNKEKEQYKAKLLSELKAKGFLNEEAIKASKNKINEGAGQQVTCIQDIYDPYLLSNNKDEGFGGNRCLTKDEFLEFTNCLVLQAGTTGIATKDGSQIKVTFGTRWDDYVRVDKKEFKKFFK